MNLTFITAGNNGTWYVNQISGDVDAFPFAGSPTSGFLVEQNANLALHVAHRGYVMENGRITMADSTKNLLADERVKQAYLGV